MTIRWGLASFALALFACLSCSSSSDSSGNGSSGNGSTDVVETKIPSSGNAVADRLAAAAAKCGVQTVSTVPTGWDLKSMGSQGCSLWTPGDWSEQGQGQSISTARDSTGGFGVMVGGGVPTGVTIASCTPKAVADLVASIYKSSNCTQTTIVAASDDTFVLGDYNIPIRHSVLTCNAGGYPIVAYIWSTAQTGALCEIAFYSFWELQSEIETATCTMTQSLASLKCPSGGAANCQDVDCDTACKNAGGSGGKCPTNGGDSCECS